MKPTTITAILATLLTQVVHGSPQPRQDAKPPYFILTGDSTVAVNGGWGDGFLSFVADPASGVNKGDSGATTVSYRNEFWDEVLSEVANTVSDYEPIVTIQFGHNDQKTLTLEEYGDNLEALATDVQGAGGTPIIITSLTRRAFENGEVIQNLADWRAEAINSAKDVGIQYLDLNIASTDYVNAIGEENGHTYDLSDGDSTHLNAAGEVVFGRMVADLMLEARPDFEGYFTPNEALSEKIANGEYATGDE
ncbi:hypothetical protein FE257_010266 [Aspergillus nanangensis]|uniref:SGNH hydrolase-type esterase domain-containing protein n=1 Tax=Aspergillus nanangensis TaxID=2582783 RepID=A0AAD4GSB7_ASPNN|nr:hypothetical protein FE257_010266 [Aspergillus nanangensis]